MKKSMFIVLSVIGFLVFLTTCKKEEEKKVLLPTINTLSVNEITTTTAKSGGSVTDDGGGVITSRGIVWSTSPNPTVEQHSGIIIEGPGIGVFQAVITGLSPNTNYYLRAYAMNSAGTAYGNQVMFKTIEMDVPPTVTTTSISNIGQSNATGGGNVTSAGNSPVTARGVCWSMSSNPTVADQITSDGAGVGSYLSNINDLTANTQYYVRAYATNSTGTSYGNQVIFKTNEMGLPPTVTTNSISNIGQNNATGGGNVTSAGNSPVAARGICWSMSSNPTVTDQITSDGTGAGSFVSTISGLAANTQYYVRAYATNSSGTSYGNEVMFKTIEMDVPPTVTTNSISNIGQNNATGGGNVTSDGNSSVTARGVCWSTSSSPTIKDQITSDGSGVGGFVSNISGLAANTQYYVRAYATNSSGTSYGNEVMFKTIEMDVPPTVTTSSISNIGQNNATGGGNVISEGNSPVTARGVCWSTSSSPTIKDQNTSDGSGVGGFVSNISGLTANTQYFVRAYATNNTGTSYGDEETFVTAEVVTLPTVTTSNIINIGQNNATGGGNVTASGNSTVTGRGVCWSKFPDPDIYDTLTFDGTGTGIFLSNINGLNPNTLYYVRAYATNSLGTAYGNNVQFTTQGGTTGDPLLYFPFNGNANDESGNGNNGTVIGATLTSDRFGNANKAYNFDGVNDRITTIFKPTNINSISVWFYAQSSQPHNAGVFSTYNGSDFKGYYFSFQYSSPIGLLYYDGNLGQQITLPAWNQWTHLVVCSNGNNISVYVNGTLAKSFAGKTTHAGNLFIGDSKYDSRYFKGKIDDIRVYDYPLSAVEVQYLYNEGGR